MKSSTSSAGGILIAATVLVFAITALLNTWLLMLLIGVLHLNVLDAIHPIGFWTTAPIAVLVTMIFGSSSNAGSNK